MKYINKLTYCSYDGFMEMYNLRNNYDSVLELDCKDITTEDKASGVAKIQYSFDNSTWGDLSLLASRGIQVSGTKATGTEEWTLKDRNNNVWFSAFIKD